MVSIFVQGMPLIWSMDMRLFFFLLQTYLWKIVEFLSPSSSQESLDFSLANFSWAERAMLRSWWASISSLKTFLQHGLNRLKFLHSLCRAGMNIAKNYFIPSFEVMFYETQFSRETQHLWTLYIIILPFIFNKIMEALMVSSYRSELKRSRAWGIILGEIQNQRIVIRAVPR